MAMPQNLDWPDDADGGVFRRLAKDGFDFSRPREIDFNIDFRDWPPPAEAIKSLQSRYSFVKTYDDDRYVLVKIRASLTYELVVRTQAVLSEQMRVFGGTCESWGVLRNSN